MMNRLLFAVWLLLFAAMHPLAAQQVSVTGRVTDATSGIPLSGVTISVVGSSAAVATDNNGNFTINVPGDGVTLSFRAVGYAQQQISVGQNRVINVTLDPSNKALDEVMVVAYGTATRASYTGAASTISAEDRSEERRVGKEGRARRAP